MGLIGKAINKSENFRFSFNCINIGNGFGKVFITNTAQNPVIRVSVTLRHFQNRFDAGG